MPILRSRLHAELGIDARAITYQDLEAAVAAGVVEHDDLDWKRALPSTDVREYCKDVAAMANTRGGLLVFGVNEDRGTGRAASISAVDTTERSQRRLRAVLSQISPMVAGIEIDAVDGPDPGQGVMIVAVPASADAPHLIHNNTLVGVPYRVGPETAWMRERDIERAYRDRFTQREDELSRLDALLTALGEQVDHISTTWIAAVAKPRVTLPAAAAPPTRDDITAALNAALGQISALGGPAAQHGMLRYLDSDAVRNPRVGLRRWIAYNRPYDPAALSKSVHVELHHDGTVSLAAAINGWYDNPVEECAPVLIPLVETFVLDMVGLTLAYSSARGVTSAYACKVDIVRSDDRPLAAVDNVRAAGMVLSSFEQPSWSRNVQRFLPVVSDLPAPGDMPSALAAAREISTDVLSQFGIPNLRLLPELVPGTEPSAEDEPSPTSN